MKYLPIHNDTDKYRAWFGDDNNNNNKKKKEITDSALYMGKGPNEFPIPDEAEYILTGKKTERYGGGQSDYGWVMAKGTVIGKVKLEKHNIKNKHYIANYDDLPE